MIDNFYKSSANSILFNILFLAHPSILIEIHINLTTLRINDINQMRPIRFSETHKNSTQL